MGKKHQHSVKCMIKEYWERIDRKTIAALWVIEFTLFLFVVYKGLGMNYLPVTFLLMFFTALSCSIVSYFKADRCLLILVLILLNLGFVIQEIEFGGNVSLLNSLLKFTAVISFTLLGAFLYKLLADMLSRDRVMKGLMLLQILICIAMSCLGTMVGDSEEQGAIITLGGITLFEIVKLLYLFVAAALLCKPEIDTFDFFKYHLQREYVLIIHTILLSFFFLFCRELGTLLVVLLIGMIMLYLFGKKRKWIKFLVITFISSFLSVWYLCDQLIYPMIVANKISLPSVILKLISRFGTALHPEKFMKEVGYQGTMGLEAIAIGDLFGISTERHRVTIPEASSDFIFADVIQTCGFVMGVIIIVFFLILLKRGMEIADQCQDSYFQGLTIAISVLITVETVIHVGYNIALLPIMGIPLYFISQGFTAVLTGMLLIAILLVISIGAVTRKVE